MKKLFLCAVVFGLAGCVASMWHERHGEVELPLITASHVGSEFEITGADVKISNVMVILDSVRWDAETTI